MAGASEYMAGRVVHLPDLLPPAGGHTGEECEAFPVLKLQVDIAEVWRYRDPFTLISYTPSEGGAPRLVATMPEELGNCLGVFDTGTGAFLHALEEAQPDADIYGLLTYQRHPDGRPRIAAVECPCRIAAQG
jgi:hypothetical protein